MTTAAWPQNGKLGSASQFVRPSGPSQPASARDEQVGLAQRIEQQGTTRVLGGTYAGASAEPRSRL